MITLHSIIIRNDKDFLVSMLGNETVMMNTETGDYLGLNEVSSDIWKLLEQPSSAQDIITKLLDMYDIDRDQCEQQTMKFLSTMAEQKMITVSE